MKKPSINGWQRIGIVASVLWMLGALIHNSVKPDWATGCGKSCVTRALNNLTPNGVRACFDQWKADYPVAIVTHRWNTAGDVFLPVVLGWFVAGISIAAYIAGCSVASRCEHERRPRIAGAPRQQDQGRAPTATATIAARSARRDRP